MYGDFHSFRDNIDFYQCHRPRKFDCPTGILAQALLISSTPTELGSKGSAGFPGGDIIAFSSHLAYPRRVYMLPYILALSTPRTPSNLFKVEYSEPPGGAWKTSIVNSSTSVNASYPNNREPRIHVEPQYLVYQMLLAIVS